MTKRLALRLIILPISLAIWALAHFGGRDLYGNILDQLKPAPMFKGDLDATMPQDETLGSAYSNRTPTATNLVRVVFEKESQPKFAELIKSALRKQWNPNLGYELVFGESSGLLEEAATIVTYRMTVRPQSEPYQTTGDPHFVSLYSSIRLITHACASAEIQKLSPPHVGTLTRDPVPTSWPCETMR